MATETIVKRTADLTVKGGETGDVKAYRIKGGFDATPGQIDGLRTALRKLGISDDMAYIYATEDGKPAGQNGNDAAAIREWARANGKTVSDRGRVSETLRAEWTAAVGS